MTLSLTVNGASRTIASEPDTPLLWVLRDELRLTGAKFGCGIAQCGACTVLIDGQARRACVTPVAAVDGAQVTTIEGLQGDVADAVRAAWADHDTPQCGYCQSGQIMTAAALLARNRAPDEDDVDNAFAGNICRCATYMRIRKAVHAAAKKLEA